MLCVSCKRVQEDFARIRVEVVDKKSRKVIEVLYGELICMDCLKKRYKERNRLRIYV